MKMIAYHEFANASPVERSLHQRFYEKRCRGEWFRLDDSDLRVIAQVCGLLGGSKLEIQIETIDGAEDDEINADNIADVILLGDETRRMIEYAINQRGGVFRVTEIAKELHLQIGKVSQITRSLEEAGLLTPVLKDEMGHNFGRQITEKLRALLGDSK